MNMKSFIKQLINKIIEYNTVSPSHLWGCHLTEREKKLIEKANKRNEKKEKKIMEAKICDKCGKAYNKKLFEKTGAMFINHYQRPLFEPSVSYDLCPECFKKLKKWINNEEDEKNK